MPDTNAKRILAYGLRDATNLAVRPGTSDIWVTDRGGGYWEEINRVSSATTRRNFGWPCYEGNNIRKRSDEQDLSICEGLYSAGNADTDPYWAYDHELPVHPDENCEQGCERLTARQHAVGSRVLSGGGRHVPAHVQERAVLRRPAAELHLGNAAGPGDGAAQEGQRDPVLGRLPGSHAQRGQRTSRSPRQGDLLYINQRTDVVQRISYLVANQAPTAVATATPVSGVTPLAVTFSGLGSTDPDAGDVLTYAWDLDGDNLLDDSTLAQPTFTYETPGTYTVTLQVTDTRGATALATVTVTVTDSGLRTLRFAPIADSRVEAANSGTNYGTQTKLRTDGSPQVESLLRFNVAGIAGTVQSAKLRLSALADGTADGPALYTAASGWTETGVKWSNRPTFGATALGDKGAVAANSAIEYDVKSLVTGNGELNLGLRQTSGDSLELASREDTTAARRPVLEVTYALPAPDPRSRPGPGPGPDAGPEAGPRYGPQTSPFVTVPSLTAPVTGNKRRRWRCWRPARRRCSSSAA